MKPRFNHILLLLCFGLLLVTMYSITHSFPAKRGGLYLIWAEQVANNSFLYPKDTIGYTYRNIPFAYPPVGIYLMAVPIALGVPSLLVARIMPGVIYVISIIALYIFVTEYYDSSLYGLLAGIFALACPQILSQTIVGAGVTRSLGILFVSVGLIFVYRSFCQDHVNKDIFVSGILFGLSITTHPIFALLFVYGTIMIFIILKPSILGIFIGITIAALGFMFATPYIFTVVTQNSLAVLLSPSGRFSILYWTDMLVILFILLVFSIITKRRLNRQLNMRLVLICILTVITGFIIFEYNGTNIIGNVIDTPYRFAQRFDTAIHTIWFLERSSLGYIYTTGGLLGSYCLIRDKRVLIPSLAMVWLLAYNHYPSVFLLLSILTGVAVAKILVDIIELEYQNISSRRCVMAFMIMLILPALVLSGLYVGSYSTLGIGSPPNNLNSDSVDMMEYANENTQSDSVFLIGGNNNGKIVDWFPVVSNRTVSVSPWGTEWVVNQTYQRGYHMSITIRASNCGNPNCYDDIIRSMHSSPDYIVIQRHDASVSDFVDAKDYTIVYNKKEYLIIRVAK